MSFSLQGTITEKLLQEFWRSIPDTTVISIGIYHHETIGDQSERIAGYRNN